MSDRDRQFLMTKKAKFDHRQMIFKNNYKMLSYMYYILGFIQLLFSIFIATEYFHDFIWLLNIFVAVLGGTLNFFKLETCLTMQRHTYNQYQELIRDIELELSIDENHKEFIHDVLVRQKAIQSSEEILSDCWKTPFRA